MSASDKRTNAQLIECAKLTADGRPVDIHRLHALAVELAERLERSDAKIRDIEAVGRLDAGGTLCREMTVVLNYMPLALSDLDAINFRNDLHAARKR